MANITTDNKGKDYLREYLDEYDATCDKFEEQNSNYQVSFHVSNDFAKYDEEDEIENEI